MTFWNRQRRFVPLFFFFFSFSTLTGWGQNVCDPAVQPQTGSFTVPAQVCVGQQFTVSNVPTSLINISYSYQYDGRGLPTSGVRNTSNVYTAPGSYTILQVAAGGNATGTIACRVIEVLPIKPIVFSVTSCSNRSVTLAYTLDVETFRYNSLNIDWGDGQAPEVIQMVGSTGPGRVSHSYVTQGPRKTIRVNGAYTNACSGPSSMTTVELINTTTADPNILSLTSAADKATINFQGPDGYSLSLFRKNTAGTYVSTGLTGVGGGIFTVSALPTETNCFKIIANDACGSQPKESPEVCSLVLTGKAEDRRNELTWQPYAGRGASFKQYNIYRDGGPPVGSSTSVTLTSFADAVNILCGRQYCYVLEAVVNNPTTSPTTIRSLSTCVTGYDNGTVASPTSAFVSVQPNGVSLQTTLPTLGLPSLYTLVVTRAEGAAGTYGPLTTTDMTSYIDNTAQTNSQSYCYQVAVRNNCGTLSKSTPPACTILLTNANGVLRWTTASPFSDGPPRAYQLIFVDPITGLSDTRQLGTATSYQPDPNSSVTDYQLAALDPIGLSSYSNPTRIELGMRVLLPTAFTPNGDGVNDAFMAKGQTSFWDTFSLTIFDRWGGVVFNSIDKTTTGWNGDINGTPATSGYYSYKIRVTDQAGKAFDRTGQVLLIR